MYAYSFDKLSLAIAVSPDELKGLISGKQTAVLKNTRTPYKGGLKCYLYETKAGGGRGMFVAIGELEIATFYSRSEEMYRDCGLTAEEADEKRNTKLRYGVGMVFYIKNVVEVPDPEVLSHNIQHQFLIDNPKKVTQMKK